MGKNTVQTVWEIAEPIAESLGLVLWDVCFEKEGANYYLRIYIDKDGGVGPYVQSERVKAGIYMEYAKKLIEKGEAYISNSLRQSTCRKEQIIVEAVQLFQRGSTGRD